MNIAKREPQFPWNLIHAAPWHAGRVALSGFRQMECAYGYFRDHGLIRRLRGDGMLPR